MANHVRAAREKLTSSATGLITFDIELLRLYAEGRCAAALPLTLLALAIAATTTLWMPIFFVAVWLGVVLSAIGLAALLAARFLKQNRAAIKVENWRARFIFTEALNGMSWAFFALVMIGVSDPWATTYVMVVFMLIAALHTALTAFVPAAVYSALAPIGLAIVLYMRPSGFHGPVAPLTMLACGAQLYFVVLARRVYASRLETLSFQAEKDLLIAELEQAKANSDEARRRAEEASLAKSRFLATMSHELRTPLNAVLGFSEVMQNELFGAHAVPVYREYSSDIHSSGEHLLMLINEILDLSRVEAGRYELKEDAVSLPEIIEDCRHLLALRAKKREVTLIEMTEPNMPRLWADERAVRQITLNLLTNAVKFTPQGGQVTIKTGWTVAGGQYFSVKDTGPGIPAEEIPIVMSSFGRGTMAQKNADEGSGLGLPIVKGLVELHGGTFTLTSKLREGTEVTVVFPPERVMNALPQLDPAEPPAPPPLRRATRNAA